jgi:hypothetical protein
MFAPRKSPVRVQPKILGIFSGELHIVYMDRRACFSSYSECYVDCLGFVDFHSQFFKAVLGLQVGRFVVSVKQWLDHYQWLVLHYCR